MFVLQCSCYNERRVPIYSLSVYVHKRSQLDSGFHEALRFPTGLSSGSVSEDVLQISVSKSEIKRRDIATAGFV